MSSEMRRVLAAVCAVSGLIGCGPVIDEGTPITNDARLSTSPGISVGFDFGSVAVGQSATATVGIENSGTTALTVSAATLNAAPGVSMTSPALPLTLAAGSAANVTLRFAPTAGGAVSGTLVLTSNAVNSPTTLSVAGTGTGGPDAGHGSDAGTGGGPIRLVQHVACVGAANSTVTCTLPSASQRGDLLLVVGGWSPTTDTSNKPTDKFGNAFNLVAQSGSDQLVVLYYAQNIAGGSAHSVTWTVSGGTATPLSLELAEFSGASTTSAYSGRFNSGTGSSATPNAGSVTPTSPGSLVFGAMAHDGTFTSSAGAGFTLLDIATDNAANLNPAVDEFLIATSTSAVSGAFGLTGSTPWSAIVAVFESGGGSGGPPPDAGTGGKDAGTGGSGTCAPTASGPGGAGSANVPGSHVPAFPSLPNAFKVTGLDTSGSADVGALIQQAVNAHAQIIIPGSGSFGAPFEYNVKTQVNVPDNVIVECETGAEFLDSTPCLGSMAGLFLWSGTASVAGAGMYGCMFRGTAANISVPTSYNHSFIRLNTAHNYTIEGNYTTNSCGDADIRLDGCECSSTDHGSTGNLVAFNDMENAENGIAVINGWDNTVTCNTAFNGGLIDEEPNHSYAQCGHNTYSKNYEEVTFTLPNHFGVGTSVGGNNASCPPGSGVCAIDTVTDNVFNGNGFGSMGVDCECNAAGTACDNSKFGGVWSGNILVGGTKCGCGSACTN